MKTRGEIENMRERAYREQGWTDTEDGPRRMRPLGDDPDKEIEERAYAAGVEAGLLWAIGDAGSPFPR